MVERHETHELVARGVGVEVAGATLLGGVDVTCTPGRATAIIGPNGAGKTTLMHTLAGIRAPSRGSVTLGGRELGGMRAAQRARALALVLQAKPAAFGFSALELVLMGVEQGRGRFSLPGAKDVARAQSALDALSCGALASRAATTLSGGELQRVLMARALASGAPWWLLDEPTAALDPRHQLDVMRLMRAHCARGGGAVVVMHDLDLVESFFDEVIVLDEGELVIAGAKDEVMSEERLSELYGVRLVTARVGTRRTWSLDPGPDDDE